MPTAPSTCYWPAMTFPPRSIFPAMRCNRWRPSTATSAVSWQRWAFKSREPVMLGGDLLAGEWVRASYLRDGKRIWQSQAVFALADGRVLVFTLAMARKLTPQDDALLQHVLNSYRAA